ncbi:uncharacterized protein TNCV_4266671 [Trichonephila clavipes]|nr:uncharacterized protein TNCV_4266671 [Trichonephila clavipes]
MTIVFVCEDPVVNASILPLLYNDTRSHSLSDGRGCHCLQYTVTPSVLIHGTMTAQRNVHDILQPHVLPLMQWLPGAIFKKTMLDLTPHKTVSTLLLPLLGLPYPQICLKSSISEIIWDGELEIPRV